MGLGPYLLLAVLEGLVQASILTITAVGLSLVFGVMRVVNVAHGEFVMLGAIVAWFVADRLDGDPGLAFAIALVVSPIVVGAIALVCDRLILKRLGYDPEATIVATIGVLYIVQQTVLLGYGPDARAVDPPFYYTVRTPWFGYPGYKLAVIGFAVVAMAAIWFVLKHTRAGLLMRATQFDPEIAAAFGMPVRRVQTAVFVLGGMLAAAAGVLVVPIQQAHYLMGSEPLLLSFVVVIIGGLGSIAGTVVAAVFVGLSDGILSVAFSPTLAKIVSTLLVALVLVFRPDGLFRRAAR